MVHRETMQGKTQSHGTPTDMQASMLTVAQLWHHIEMLTMVVHQCVMGRQLAQQDASMDTYSTGEAHGGARCRCGCVVYPVPTAVIRDSGMSRYTTATQHAAEGKGEAAPVHEWKRWKKSFKPQPHSGKQDETSDWSSFAALASDFDTEQDNEHDDESKTHIGEHLHVENGETDQVAEYNRLPRGKRPQQHPETDEDVLALAIAEAQAADHVVQPDDDSQEHKAQPQLQRPMAQESTDLIAQVEGGVVHPPPVGATTDADGFRRALADLRSLSLFNAPACKEHRRAQRAHEIGQLIEDEVRTEMG